MSSNGQWSSLLIFLSMVVLRKPRKGATGGREGELLEKNRETYSLCSNRARVLLGGKIWIRRRAIQAVVLLQWRQGFNSKLGCGEDTLNRSNGCSRLP